MSKDDESFLGQVKHHAVALISLVVALTALSYNTWRNEKSEDNHNHRQAAFQILMKLNELQRVVFHLRYDRDQELGNPRVGWVYVLTVQDLAQIVEPSLQEEADQLHSAWGANWDGLEDSQRQVDEVLGAVDAMRLSTLELLKSLD